MSLIIISKSFLLRRAEAAAKKMKLQSGCTGRIEKNTILRDLFTQRFGSVRKERGTQWQ